MRIRGSMAAGIQFTRLVSSSRFGDCAVDYALQRACKEAFEHVLGGLGVGASAPFAATLNRARLDNSIGKIWSTKLTSRERAPRGRRYRSRRPSPGAPRWQAGRIKSRT